jgi:hypothetical protein
MVEMMGFTSLTIPPTKSFFLSLPPSEGTGEGDGEGDGAGEGVDVEEESEDGDKGGDLGRTI